MVWRKGIVVKYFIRISVRISCAAIDNQSAIEAGTVKMVKVSMIWSSYLIIT